MTSHFQIVHELLEEFGSNGPTSNWNLYRRLKAKTLFDPIITDMLYIISPHSMERFLPDEEAAVYEAERHFEIERKAMADAREIAETMSELMYGWGRKTPLREQHIEAGKAASRVSTRIGEKMLSRQALRLYMVFSGEYPTVDVFKRNADGAITNAEESPHFLI